MEVTVFKKKGEMSYWEGREPGCAPWVDKGAPEDL